MDFLIYHLASARRPIRATRYRREIPSLYRVVGANYWQRGLTMNISESGVLLQAASPLALHTRLEMTFQVSEPIGRFQVGQVACIGEVVRHARQPSQVHFPSPPGSWNFSDRLVDEMRLLRQPGELDAALKSLWPLRSVQSTVGVSAGRGTASGRGDEALEFVEPVQDKDDLWSHLGAGRGRRTPHMQQPDHDPTGRPLRNVPHTVQQPVTPR